MRPYTKEGIREAEGFATFQDGTPVVFQPDHCYEYNLRGMVIHTGSADRGHYYSFIKERNEDGEEVFMIVLLTKSLKKSFAYFFLFTGRKVDGVQ